MELGHEYLPEVEAWFTYHAPHGDQTERYQQIRDGAKTFALLIADCVPNSMEREWAWARLREVCMWANAGIAVNEAE